MGNNTAGTSVVDAVPASDSAAKRLTGDERRREILDAVRTVSSELGVSHLSVSAVTKRAGCTRSLFYHYFADMDAAVTAVMDEAIDDFISELERWNADRTVGDIEGALDTVAPLFKRLVASGHELPSTLTSSSGALYGGFLHNVVQRVAQYICDTTVVDFVAHHELRIDHVYETFYTLIMGLFDVYPHAPRCARRNGQGNHRLDTPHRGLYRQVSGAQAPELTTFGQTARDQKRGRGRVKGEQHAVRCLG